MRKFPISDLVQIRMKISNVVNVVNTVPESFLVTMSPEQCEGSISLAISSVSHENVFVFLNDVAE